MSNANNNTVKAFDSECERVHALLAELTYNKGWGDLNNYSTQVVAQALTSGFIKAAAHPQQLRAHNIRITRKGRAQL